jgi:hypothetical protein
MPVAEPLVEAVAEVAAVQTGTPWPYWQHRTHLDVDGVRGLRI